MTYNIPNGGNGREDLIRQVIEAARPEVVVLQEVDTEGFMHSLGRALEMDHYLGSSNASHRVALLSRFPIRNPRSFHPSPPIWRNVIDASIEYAPGRTFRLIGVHPMPNLGILCEAWRLGEARRVIRHCRQYADEPLLIAGDFNAVAPGDRVRTGTMPAWLKLILLAQGNRVYHFSMNAYLASGLFDCYRLMNPEDEGFTLPPPTPNTRLDYLLANQPMRNALMGCSVIRGPSAVLHASDHYPVVADFSFPTEI
ncbi:endonuclease/exonuclease/phosphatase family protein [Singulisphaera rosea]